MYSAYGLLKADSDFSMPEAAKRFAARFPSYTVQQRADGVIVASANWEIHLRLNDSPAVLDESRVIAGHIGGAVDGKEIAECARRVELASDIVDPEMEHFNDYLLAVETLRSFKGLIVVDPRVPSLL